MLSLSSSNRYFQRKAKRPLPTQFLTFLLPGAGPKSSRSGIDPVAVIGRAGYYVECRDEAERSSSEFWYSWLRSTLAVGPYSGESDRT